MKIGILCSSGGSTFLAAFDLLIKSGKFYADDFFVITDRQCGVEAGCDERGIERERIESDDPVELSRLARDMFAKRNITVVFLYFLRLVDKELYQNVITFNIHPSLLPCFTGFSALKKAKESTVKFIGSTLHLATGDPDAGPIIGQVISPVNIDDDIKKYERVSFVQKTYLTLCGVDLIQNGYVDINPLESVVEWRRKPGCSCSANPVLSDRELQFNFDVFQKELNMEVIT